MLPSKPTAGASAIVVYSLSLFFAGVAALSVESLVIVKIQPRLDAIGLRTLALVGSMLGLGVSLFLELDALALLGATLTAAIQPAIALARAVCLRSGEILRPYINGTVRDLPLAAGWWYAGNHVGSDVVAQRVTLVSLLIASLLQLMALQNGSASVRALMRRKASGQAAALLAAGIALHSSLSVVARMGISATLPGSSLIAFELTERANYLLVAGFFGSVGTELQRRWSVDVGEERAREEAMRLSLVLAIIGILVGGLIAIGGVRARWGPVASVGGSTWAISSIAMGFFAGVGALLTILTYWELAQGRAKIVTARLLAFGSLGVAFLIALFLARTPLPGVTIAMAMYGLLLGWWTWKSVKSAGMRT